MAQITAVAWVWPWELLHAPGPAKKNLNFLKITFKERIKFICSKLTIPVSTCFCCCFVFFRAALTTHRCSQDRGQNGTAAAGLCHSHRAMGDLSHVCDLHHSSQWRQIPYPLMEARDQTCILMDTSRVCYRWAIAGTPTVSTFVYLCVYFLFAIWVLSNTCKRDFSPAFSVLCICSYILMLLKPWPELKYLLFQLNYFKCSNIQF